MRRLSFFARPLLIAGVAFVVASPALLAQQHTHPTAEATGHNCACCENSGGSAMKHDASGCCGSQASAQPNAAADHAAMNHAAAKTESAAPGQAMDHGAAGCCGNMAAAKGQKADAAPNHDAGAGCCAGMAHDMATGAKADAKPMSHAMSGAGCGSMAMDHGAAGCCADMAKPDAAKH